MRHLALTIAALALPLSLLPRSPASSDDELRRRVGGMIVVGFRGTEISPDSPIVKAVNELGLGGVVLFDYDFSSKSFPRNILDPAQTKTLISDLAAYSDHPLLVCIDAEGGRVIRLKAKYGFEDIPAAEYLGGENDLELTRRFASTLANELRGLGINVNFAPVVDVNVNPENPVIGGLGRSFSGDPDIVTNHARAFIQAHSERGIVTCAKHFPGHGSSSHDSHMGMVDVTDTYRELELEPYKTLIGEGALDAVMTAHLFDRNVDPDYPATLSAKFLKDMLRGELGFRGVIVSDDMHMGAITKYYSFEDSLVAAVNAGCDLLIFSNNGDTYDEDAPYRAVDAVLSAVAEGRIAEERIDEAYGRILKLREKMLQRSARARE